MTRRRQMKKISAILATAGALPALTSATVAQAAPVAHAAKAMKYCMTVLSGHKNSKVVYHGCASSQALLKRQSLGALPRNATLTPLLTFYQNLSYGGASSTINGLDGPCDASGYGFTDLSGIESSVNGITSYKVHNRCNETKYYTGFSFTGTASTTHTGDTKWVGKVFNDNMYSIRTWY